jgi:hypothetical protein
VTFQEWVDIDGGAGDHGVLRVLDASGLPGTVTELAVVLANVVGLSDDVDEWVEYSADLPEAALGHSVVLEFRLVSDAVEDNLAAGWYLDDVTVTTPAP